jgi:hypothetical protein
LKESGKALSKLSRWRSNEFRKGFAAFFRIDFDRRGSDFGQLLNLNIMRGRNMFEPGQKMGESFGQTVVIENKPGANGNLGADSVAKSAPDGYTLVLMDVGNLAISPSLYKLPFNVANDFAPVAMVAYSPHLLVVSTQVPAKNTKELVEWVKDGKVTVE